MVTKWKDGTGYGRLAGFFFLLLLFALCFSVVYTIERYFFFFMSPKMCRITSGRPLVFGEIIMIPNFCAKMWTPAFNVWYHPICGACIEKDLG